MHMRTTINLNDELLERAKLRAVQERRTLTSVVEAALRAALDSDQRPSVGELEAPVDGSGGLQPRVDLDDTSSLHDRMADLR